MMIKKIQQMPGIKLSIQKSKSGAKKHSIIFTRGYQAVRLPDAHEPLASTAEFSGKATNTATKQQLETLAEPLLRRLLELPGRQPSQQDSAQLATAGVGCPRTARFVDQRRLGFVQLRRLGLGLEGCFELECGS